ncbi:hypothetical protein GCM10008023_36370 [Sphingomonas glacialis]|uniref:Uncharacterized protein n=1 Tax=Sphingomonas glacialis TaxID=658225 RepID=A0ABQ3LS53_9SPHN|nr:hypothetical protein GCM10008023_36370 [Sphingomonas glacialis]
MTITIFLILVSVGVAGARFATMRRTMLPVLSSREERKASVEAAFEHEPTDDGSFAKSAAPRPAQAVKLARTSGYLLSDGPNVSAVDRTAIMLNAMAGPGLCTPRTG